MQSPKLSASQAQSIAQETVIILEKLRDDHYFLLYWKEVLTESKELDIDEPAFGRKRKASRRREDDYSRSSIGFFHEKFEDFARQIYFVALDLLINAIKNRSEQENYKHYIILENLLLKCAKDKSHEEELETVFNNYSEFQREQLPQQLEQFSNACRQVKDKDFPSLLDVVKQMNTYEKAHISQVIELFKLILVLPTANASSERSFSLLRLVKSYLRATIGQGRLYQSMIPSAYKENVDELNLKDVVREFIHKNDTIISLFEKI